MTIEERVEEIKQKIDELHGDTSVTQQETADALREIEDHATMLADLVESEIEPEPESESEDEAGYR